MARQIAVIGIDGAGKSTLIRRLVARGGSDGLAVVHCPAYHENPDAPLGGLSRAAEAYSQAADALASFELKAAALYLQMTLFGPVARALDDAFAPRVLLYERHPVVDTLAYGPFYRRMVQKPVDGDAMAAGLEAEIERRVPGGYARVRAWLDAENRRLGMKTSFWELAHEVCALLARPLAEVLPELARRYRASLPDVVVLVDVDAEEARRRCPERSAGGELHETLEYLGALRQSYDASLAALAAALPSVVVRRITTGGGRSIEASLDELVAAAGIGET